MLCFTLRWVVLLGECRVCDFSTPGVWFQYTGCVISTPVCDFSTPGVWFQYPGCVISTPGVQFQYPRCAISVPRVCDFSTQCLHPSYLVSATRYNEHAMQPLSAVAAWSLVCVCVCVCVGVGVCVCVCGCALVWVWGGISCQHTLLFYSAMFLSCPDWRVAARSILCK